MKIVIANLSLNCRQILIIDLNKKYGSIQRFWQKLSISTQKWILNKTFRIEIIVNRFINMTLPDAISFNEDNPKTSWEHKTNFIELRIKYNKTTYRQTNNNIKIGVEISIETLNDIQIRVRDKVSEIKCDEIVKL